MSLHEWQVRSIQIHGVQMPHVSMLTKHKSTIDHSTFHSKHRFASSTVVEIHTWPSQTCAYLYSTLTFGCILWFGGHACRPARGGSGGPRRSGALLAWGARILGDEVRGCRPVTTALWLLELQCVLLQRLGVQLQQDKTRCCPLFLIIRLTCTTIFSTGCNESQCYTRHYC